MNRFPPDVESQLIACQAALQHYQPGRDPASLVEISKLELADSVLEWAARVARLPVRAERPARVIGRYRRVKRA